MLVLSAPSMFRSDGGQSLERFRRRDSRPARLVRNAAKVAAHHVALTLSNGLPVIANQHSCRNSDRQSRKKTPHKVHLVRKRDARLKPHFAPKMKAAPGIESRAIASLWKRAALA